MSKRIVIVGGMGPQASLELHRRIILNAALAGAVNNEDYPEILHISIPVPDFISAGDNLVALRRLERSLDGIKFRKGDKIVLACNTAHLLLPKLERRYNIRFISLIDSTVDTLKKGHATSVGLLASPTTIKERLYEKPIRAVGLNMIIPTDKEMSQLESAIRGVIANGSTDKARKLVEPTIQRMLHDGADCIILGCTELSLILNDHQYNVLVDPLDALR